MFWLASSFLFFFSWTRQTSILSRFENCPFSMLWSFPTRRWARTPLRKSRPNTVNSWWIKDERQSIQLPPAPHHLPQHTPLWHSSPNHLAMALQHPVHSYASDCQLLSKPSYQLTSPSLQRSRKWPFRQIIVWYSHSLKDVLTYSWQHVYRRVWVEPNRPLRWRARIHHYSPQSRPRILPGGGRLARYGLQRKGRVKTLLWLGERIR